MADIQKQKESTFRVFFKGEGLKRAYDTAATGIGFVNSYLTITYLTVFEFGLIQLLLSFVSVIDSLNIDIFDGIVTVEIRRYFNRGKAEFAKRLFWESAVLKIGIAVLFTAAIFGGSEVIAQWYGQDVAFFIRVVSMLLIARALFTSEAGFLKSVMNFSHWSFPALREGIKLFMLLWALFFYYLNISVIVVAHVAAEAAAVVVITLFVFVKVYRRNAGSVQMNKETLLGKIFRAHGKWVAIRYLFSRVTKNAMPWFIKVFVNTEAVAYYSLAVGIIALAEGLMPMAGVSTILLMKVGVPDQIAFIFKRSLKYMVWLGTLFMLGGFIVLPPLVLFVFPKYGPTLPILYMMLFAFPLYGAYKVLKPTLTVLQEYKILALRIMREALVVPLAAVIFLPLLGVVGAGLAYNAVYWERTPFLYRKLTEKYPDFKLKLSELFRFDETDAVMLKRAWGRLRRAVTPSN